MGAEFLKAFWPNLFATLAGVGLGVPLALWLNRKAQESARSVQRDAEERVAAAQRAAEDARLSNALHVLQLAIRSNATLLGEVGQLLRAGGVAVTGLIVNASAWEATKGQIVPLLRDPGLCLRLAHHFEQLAVLVAHVGRHADFFYGMASTLSNAAQNRKYFGEQLVPFAQRLEKEAAELVDAVAAAKAKLPSPVSELGVARSQT